MALPEELNGVKIPKNKLMAYCKKNHIKKLAFFGSLLGDDFNPESDIDILIEFEEEYIPGLFDLVRMEEELSTLFNGQKVDLRTPNDLSRYFRNKVISNAEIIYAGN